MKKKILSILPKSPLFLTPPPTTQEVDYDSLWKFLIEAFGFQFIRRFLPDMYPDVDLSHPIEYLDQEFPSKIRPKKKGRKITDKLMKVRLLSGEDRFILAHVEVHATGESTFAKKMYLYNSLIYLQYDTDITSLAIFTTERYPTNHNLYTRDCYGTEVRLKFNSFIISTQDERTLSKSDDLFDLAILACLYIIRTRNDMVKRLYYKKKLHKIAEEKNFSHIELEKILIFVEEILQLPEPLEFKFKKHLKFKAKKLEEMEIPINSQRMFAAIFEGMYGMTVEKMMKRADAADKKSAKADMDIAKADIDIAKAEEIIRIAELKEAQAEQDRMQAEQDRMQAEQDRIERLRIQTELIRILYVQNQFTAEKIAEDFKIDLEVVKEVVKHYLNAQT